MKIRHLGNVGLLEVPTIRKTSLGSTAIELGDWRIVLHDKTYSVTAQANGYHCERYINNRGWTIAESIPEDIEHKLTEAGGVMPKIRPQWRLGDFVYLTDKAPDWLIKLVSLKGRGEIIDSRPAYVSIKFFGVAEPVRFPVNTNQLRKG